MTYHAILTASLFLLLAFGIERFARASGFPAVILLIVTGIVGKPILNGFGLALEGIGSVVPVIGTIGLVLIVLEGALDIELRRERLRSAARAIFSAVSGFTLCAAVFIFFGIQVLHFTLFQAMVLAVPFAVISSAVAIPSSSFLPSHGREFVVYESSVSDIVGVLVFFSLIDSDGTAKGIFLALIGGGFFSLLLAVLFALGLVLVLMRIDGHIRFIPLLAGLFGLYAAGKMMHLSPLILVLLFGLALNNPKLVTRIRPLRNWLDDSYEATLKEFKVLTLELTFAVRGFFFILLGYWTDISTLVSIEAWLAAVLVLAAIYSLRYALLRIARVELTDRLVWIAPRGLITILLFLTAKEAVALPHYLDGTVMLVVLVSAAVIPLGRLRSSPFEVVAAPRAD